MDERAATALLKDELKQIINNTDNWKNFELTDVTLFRVIGIFANLHLQEAHNDELTSAYHLLNNRYEAEIAAWLAGYIDQWRVSQRHILGK